MACFFEETLYQFVDFEYLKLIVWFVDPSHKLNIQGYNASIDMNENDKFKSFFIELLSEDGESLCVPWIK